MKVIIRNLFLLSLCLMIGCHWGTGFRSVGGKIAAYTVELVNPANPEEGICRYNLIEMQAEKGEPDLYGIRIQSVYCSDSVCKVVPVDIYWNYLGEYSNYRLEKSYSLEKVGGELFTKDDYLHLDRILHDEQSPFRTISIREITTSTSSEGVDAVSGATVLTLSDSVTIKGASLTCFSLWKWANSPDVQEKIREYSGKRWTVLQFSEFLNQDDRHKIYAVEQLTRLKINTPDLVNKVCKQQIKNMNLWSSLQVNYLQTLPDSLFVDAVLSILKDGNSTQQTAMLSDLLQSSREASPPFWNEVVSLLPKYQSYQGVDLLLNLMAKKNINNHEMINSVFSLLERDIIIARRAYWFLMQKELTFEKKEHLKRFYEANQEYL